MRFLIPFMALVLAFSPARAATVGIELNADPRLVDLRIEDLRFSGPMWEEWYDDRVIGELVLPGSVSGLVLSLSFSKEPERRYYVFECDPAPEALALISVQAAMMPFGYGHGGNQRWASGQHVWPQGACRIIGRGQWTPEWGLVWEDQ